MNRFFAPGREFSLIERMFSPAHFSHDGQGLGDDAFVWQLPGQPNPFVVTTDASAEGVHFRLDWTSPAQALRKALMANLSDVNAMGGESRHVFFNLGARRDWPTETFDALGAALRAMEAEFGFTISGGDTLKADSAFFSFTVIGEVEGRPLLRSACRPGHRVYVSGALGGSAAGLAALLDASESTGREALIESHLNPLAPLALGPALASLSQSTGKPVAAIDLSDGLSSELAHLARQSGCALSIRAESLPAHPALAARSFEFVRDFLLNGGEEYQLLFTGDFSDPELARLRALAPVTDIGLVSEGEGVWIEEGGEEVRLQAKGWVHGGVNDRRE